MNHTSKLHDARHVEVVRQFEGHLRLRSSMLTSRNSFAQEFLEKVFSVKCVESVTINTITSTALIRHNGNGRSDKKILKVLITKTKKSPEPARPSIPSFLLPLKWLTGQVTFLRVRRSVTAWSVVHSTPGRIRLVHPLLRQNTDYCNHAEKALLRLPEVQTVKASAISGRVLVLYKANLPLESMLTVLDEELEAATGKRRKRKQNEKSLTFSSTALVVSGASKLWMPWALPLSCGLTFCAGYPIFKEACHATFVKKKIQVDILDTIVVLGCLLYGQYAIGAFMVWILDVATALQDKTSNTSNILITQIFGKQERFAVVIIDARETNVPLDKVQTGDTVLVHTGKQIPIDGVVIKGDAMVDQQTLTGESAPIEKTTGDRVFASTVVLAGKIYIQVEQSADNTTAAKISQIITQSATYQTKVQSFAERTADKMVVPTLALATVGMATGGSNAAMAILNADYGTGIRVACPTAMLACLARAAKKGIVVKKGHALEKLSDVDCFIFDKTGTLTREMPEVVSIISCDKGVSEEQVLWYAAAAEQRFSHPIAKAILDYAANLNLKLPDNDALRYQIGFGIEVNINGDIIKVGSSRFMRKEHIVVPNIVLNHAAQAHSRGGMLVLLSRNGTFLGAIELESSHRPEAYGILQQLKERRGGTEIILLSGDTEQTTRALAEQLPIDDYRAQVLPQDKARYVRMQQKRGRTVAMTGDGINDAIALSKADVSISLRGGSEIASDVADIIFMDGDLAKFDFLMNTADMLNNNIKRSFSLIAVSNTICIAGALFGAVGLSTSLILNNGINFFVLLRGMTPLFILEDDSQINQSI